MQFPWAILQIVRCPNCHHPKCHRYGHYPRKGTFRSPVTHQPTKIIRVQRFFCRPCGGTHSILPDSLLPICRWRLGDILIIAVRFAMGETAYAISKSLGESLAGLLHLKGWIAKADAVVAALAREMGLMDAEPPRPTTPRPGEALALADRFPTWRAFTHAFSRAFYPKRFPLRSTHTILTG